MGKTAVIAILAAGWGLAGPLAAGDCTYQERHEERIDAAGLKMLHVIARAGSLRISGQAGSSAVEVRGTSCAWRKSSLERIHMRTARSGSEATVEVEIRESFSWRDDYGERLDLVIDVPSSLALDVEDGSGPIEIRDVAAATVKDGSGEMLIQGVAEVRIKDGSGSIQVRDAGSVVIDDDGSGTIDVTGVRGSVLVRNQGWGDISVRQVAGDFTVQDDHSGTIAYSLVGGRVRLPSRD